MYQEEPCIKKSHVSRGTMHEEEPFIKKSHVSRKTMYLEGPFIKKSHALGRAMFQEDPSIKKSHLLRVSLYQEEPLISDVENMDYCSTEFPQLMNEKSRIRETSNLSTDADCSTDTMRGLGSNHVTCVGQIVG